MLKKATYQHNKLQYPICNNCKSKKYTVIWNDVKTWKNEGVFRIVKCSNCGLVFLNPRPVPEEIGNYYPTESYWGRDLRDDSVKNDFKKERQSSYGHLYSLINKLKKKGAIFDIGAGTGIFLSYYKELGWEVFGLELSKEAVKYAKKEFNINLKNGDFMEHHFPQKSFDIVILNNSLEHLYDPFSTLTEIHKILKDDGILIITVPNIGSIGKKILGKHWYPLDPPRHLYHFSEVTLTNMLQRTGFKKSGSNHWFWIHNYSSIFESFRYGMSPRFVKKESGGLANPEYKKRFSVKKEIGKRFIFVLSSLIVLIGSVVKKSEVFTIYAVKQK